MGLTHYDQNTKHIVPGAATNDILVYNGSDFETKKPADVMNGVTVTSSTVTTLTATDVSATNVNATTLKGTTVAVTNATATSMIANIVIGAAVYPSKTVTVLTSAGNYTMTAAQLITGIISDTCNASISVTLPTVTNTIALVPGWKVGTTLNLFYRNPGNSTITLYTDANTQWTLLGTNTIAAANAKSYDFVITAANTGTVVCKGAVIA
jgi:trimeric autotransporter adhesin